jgi:ornithine cyclodeaminase/alanine dehydrogenase-like protein (mu-crystallin family)
MRDTLLLTAADVSSILDMAACIDAVENAFRAHGSAATPPPGVLALHSHDGAFHVKAGLLEARFAAKVNANYPHNRERHGLPTIQGALLLFDATNGALLALMGSGEITRLRTAAASAVAARYLARPDARTLAIVGCGVQGEAHLHALSLVRQLERVYLFDADQARAESLAQQSNWPFDVRVAPLAGLRDLARESDLVATCTTARSPILHAGDVSPGVFVAAVGADNPEKHEIDPALLAASTVVTDVTDQAATLGDLQHAIRAGALTRDAVHAELGEIVAGTKPGRRSSDEIIVFDSTGMALQDVAAASVAWERAVATGAGTRLALA